MYHFSVAKINTANKNHINIAMSSTHSTLLTYVLGNYTSVSYLPLIIPF